MKTDNKRPGAGDNSRRSTLKTLLVGGGTLTLGALPSKWTKPVVDSVILPVHAQTTETEPPPTETGPAPNGISVPATSLPLESGRAPRLLDYVIPSARASAPSIPAGFLCIESTETGWAASYDASGDVLVGSGNFGECVLLVCLGSIAITVTQENSDGSFDFELYQGGTADCSSTPPIFAGTTNEPCSLGTCRD